MHLEQHVSVLQRYQRRVWFTQCALNFSRCASCSVHSRCSTVSAFSVQLYFVRLVYGFTAMYNEEACSRVCTSIQHVMQVNDHTSISTPYLHYLHHKHRHSTVRLCLCPGATVLRMPCHCMAVMLPADQSELCRWSGVSTIHTPVWLCSLHLATPSCCCMLKTGTLFI